MQLIYSLMLISGIQQSDLVMYISIYSLFTFYSIIDYYIEYSSLCYTVDPCCLSILYIVVGVYFNPKLLVYPCCGSSLVTINLFSMFLSLFLFCK